MILQTFYALIFLIAVILWTKDIAKSVALSSTSPRLIWLRKMYWLGAKEKLLEKAYSGINTKVYSYLTRYVHKSIALKQFYINNGYPETKQLLVGKIEELEKFVEKFKYNTFSNLNSDEQDFIDRYEREEKRRNKK